jgi:hypothetical protein
MSTITGESDSTAPGVRAINTSPGDDAGAGLYARSRAAGVIGESSTWHGVSGVSETTYGVNGAGLGNASGVGGESANGAGVIGSTETGLAGVYGHTAGDGNGVRGDHMTNGVGVFGSTVGGIAAVFGQTSGAGAAVRGQHDAGGLAGFFSGDVGVTGHINCNGNMALLGDVQLIGADLAEQFRVETAPPAGSVMVLAGTDSVRVSHEPYDHAVAGVVSGAGTYRPGIVLDRQESPGRTPLALSGKVWCWADADSGPIGLGDLLTTSATPGHAMRAADRDRAFGAVIGKALGELRRGRALIPVLVALQ